MNSSYKNTVNYSELFSVMTFIKNPKKIVEIGILDGFSLSQFVDSSSKTTNIYAYDIFEKFNGNHAVKDTILSKFNQDNVHIEEKDFFDIYKDHEDNSIDILHVDVANNGDIYEFIFNNYIQKIAKGGIIILEGGSEERDNVAWMNQYNKPKIIPVINKYKNRYNIKTVQSFPSITIINC